MINEKFGVNLENYYNPKNNLKRWLSSVIFGVLNLVALVAFIWVMVAGFEPLTTHAATGIYKALNFRGTLQNSDGSSVSSGNFNMKFSIYDASTGGNCLYTARGTCGTPTAKSISVTGGVFSTLIGDTDNSDNAITIDFNSDTYWLGVTVGSDAELTPRVRIGASGYAFNADLLDGLNTSSNGGTTGFVPVTNNFGNLTLTGDPRTTDVSSSTFYINPSVATSTFPLLGLAVGGIEQFRVSASGSVFASGTIYSAGTGTSTFVSGFAAAALNITSTSVTSTFANGIQLSGGCFRDVSGNCIIASGANAWTDNGAEIYLTTSGDNVTIGASGNLGKLTVLGDTDEKQFVIKANATQNQNIFEIQNSSSAPIAWVSPVGNFGVSGTIYGSIATSTFYGSIATSTFYGSLATSTWYASVATTTFDGVTIGGSTAATGTFTGLVVNQTGSFNGILNLGDGGDDISINSNDWDISSAGVTSNLSITTSTLDNVIIGGSTPTSAYFTSASSTLLSVFNTIWLGGAVTSTLTTGNRGSATSTFYSDLSIVNRDLVMGGAANTGWLYVGDGTATTTIRGGTAGSATSTFAGDVSIPNLYTGLITMPEDGGIVDIMDLPVSASVSAGTLEGYNFLIDGIPALSVVGVSNGSGETRNNFVGIGTMYPSHLLTMVSSSPTLAIGTGAATTTLTQNSLSINIGSGYNLGRFYVDSSGNVNASGTIYGSIATSTWYASVATTTLDGVTIGGTTAATGTFTGLIAQQTTSLNGIVNIGDGGDDILINSNDWDISSAGVTSNLSITTTTLDGVTIGGSTRAAGNFTNLDFNGIGTLGDGGDAIAINSNTWDILSAGVTQNLSISTSTLDDVTIGISTAARASTTILSAYSGIFVGTTATTSIYGTATSTFGAGIQTTALNITSNSVTSTFANGIQIASGCYRMPDGSCAGAGSGWTDGGAEVYLTTSGDNVTVGGSGNLAKLTVLGDTDEKQFVIKANATQNANIFEIQNSSSAPIAWISPSGGIGSSGTIYASGSGTSTFSYGATFASLGGNIVIGNPAGADETTKFKVVGNGVVGSSSANATGTYAFASGDASQAGGYASVALGHQLEAYGDYSVALGINVTTRGAESVAIGDNVEVNGAGSVGIGLNPGTTQTITANSVMAILGGKLGVGTTAPSSTLEVLATADWFGIGNGTATTTLRGSGTSTVPYGSTFATTGGNIGIGTSNPQYLLELFRRNASPLFGFGNGSVTSTLTSGNRGAATSTFYSDLSIVNRDLVMGGAANTGWLWVGDGTATTTIRGGAAGSATSTFEGDVVISNLYSGLIELTEDGGVVPAMNIPIASAATGTIEGYTLDVDGLSTLFVGGLSDGLASVWRRGVGINTTAVSSSLAVNGVVEIGNGSTSATIYANTTSTFQQGLNVATNGGTLAVNNTPVCLQNGVNCAATSTLVSGWTDGGTEIYLTASGDNVTVGGTGNLGKLTVLGDTDEKQFVIKANATQNQNIFEVQNSSSAPIAWINPLGGIGSSGTIYASGAGTSTFGHGIAPLSNNSYDLGGYGAAWRNVYVSGTIYGGAGSYTIADTTSTFSRGAVFATAGGNVGIGIATPSSTLQIYRPGAGPTLEIGDGVGSSTLREVGLQMDYSGIQGYLQGNQYNVYNAPLKLRTNGTYATQVLNDGLEIARFSEDGSMLVTNGSATTTIASAAISTFPNSAGIKIGSDAKNITLFTVGGGEDITSSNDLHLNYSNGKGVHVGQGGTSAFSVSGTSTLQGTILAGSGGNVGVGTSSPWAKFAIDSSGTGQKFVINVPSNQASNIMEVRKSGSTNILFSIDGNGAIQSNSSLIATGITSDSHVPSGGSTYDLGSSGARWANVYSVAGNFSGTITNSGMPLVSNPLNYVCFESNTLRNSDGGTCTTSARRFKHDIETLTSGLDVVNQLRPVSFTYNETNKLNVGLIAEEVEQIDKRLVEYAGDGITPRGVKYMNLTAYLAKAIQELSSEINNMKASSTLSMTNDSSNIGPIVAKDGIDLAGSSIINIASLSGLDKKWVIDEAGNFIINGEIIKKIVTSAGEKDAYPIYNFNPTVMLTGSGSLVNGEARIIFDPALSETIDPMDPIKVTVSMTSEGAQNIYVAEKSIGDILVRETNGGKGGASFDYIIVAKRKVGGSASGNFAYQTTSTSPSSPPPYEGGGIAGDFPNSLEPATSTSTTESAIAAATSTPEISAPIASATSTPIAEPIAQTPTSTEPVAQTSTSTEPVATSPSLILPLTKGEEGGGVSSTPVAAESGTAG